MDANQILVAAVNGLRADVKELVAAIHLMQVTMERQRNDLVHVAARTMALEEWKRRVELELKSLEGVSAVVVEAKKRAFQALGLGLLGLVVLSLNTTGIIKFTPGISGLPTVSLAAPALPKLVDTTSTVR